MANGGNPLGLILGLKNESLPKVTKSPGGRRLRWLAVRIRRVGNAIGDANDRAGRCLDAGRAQRLILSTEREWPKIREIATSPELLETVESHPLTDLPDAVRKVADVAAWAESLLPSRWLSLTDTHSQQLLDLYDANLVIAEAIEVPEVSWPSYPRYRSFKLQQVRRLRGEWERKWPTATQRLPSPLGIDAAEWLTSWAEYVTAEMDCEPADPPDPRAFKRHPDYWLPDARGIEGCPEQREVLVELAFEHSTVAQQVDRAIARALSCHEMYQTKVADVGDAAAHSEAARLWHAMKDLASVLHSAADALKRRGDAADSPEATCDLTTDTDESEELDPFPNDGLYPMQKAFIWGGVRYEELTPLMMDALALLHKASIEDRRVSHDEMVNRVSKTLSGDFYKVFRKRKGKDRFPHPVRAIVEGIGSYRLVERDRRKSPV